MDAITALLQVAKGFRSALGYFAASTVRDFSFAFLIETAAALADAATLEADAGIMADIDGPRLIALALRRRAAHCKSSFATVPHLAAFCDAQSEEKACSMLLLRDAQFAIVMQMELQQYKHGTAGRSLLDAMGRTAAEQGGKLLQTPEGELKLILPALDDQDLLPEPDIDL